eukprot:90377_1
MDGNQLVSVNRKTFANNMCKFINNKALKLKGTALKLYDSLTTFDVSIINWSNIIIELEDTHTPQQSQNIIATLNDVHVIPLKEEKQYDDIKENEHVYAIKDLDHNQMMYLVTRILHQTE